MPKHPANTPTMGANRCCGIFIFPQISDEAAYRCGGFIVVETGVWTIAATSSEIPVVPHDLSVRGGAEPFRLSSRRFVRFALAAKAAVAFTS